MEKIVPAYALDLDGVVILDKDSALHEVFVGSGKLTQLLLTI